MKKRFRLLITLIYFIKFVKKKNIPRMIWVVFVLIACSLIVILLVESLLVGLFQLFALKLSHRIFNKSDIERIPFKYSNRNT